MSKQFERDLEGLHCQVLGLSAMVEEMIDCAGRALCEGDRDACRNLPVLDRLVDLHEVQVEERCLQMLALHHPVAQDLRWITAVLKINNDLERMGDLAWSMASRASALHQRPDFPLPPRLESMVLLATDMLRRALNAFVARDAEAARAVCGLDPTVDQLNREVIVELIARMEAHPQLAAPGMHCFSATRQLERIGDHATNIAEDVVFLVEGAIIRHATSAPLAVA